MSSAVRICFLLYTGLLGWEDLRTGRISLLLIASGACCGLLMTAAGIAAGVEGSGILLSRLTALIWGAGLLILSRLTRGAMGKGDGLCFCSFACWWGPAELFGLLFGALFLSAAGGSVLLLLKKRSLKGSLPFMPFVFAAAVILSLLSLLREV